MKLETKFESQRGFPGGDPAKKQYFEDDRH